MKGIFNIELEAKMKSHPMPEQVVFWKWITPKMLGLVTQTSVYHWSIEGWSLLVKPYMVAVQSNNVTAVNEALNEIYVEEEDYERLQESIDLHGSFDQIGLAQKIEKHELLEMQQDNLYKDAMETASQSGDRKLVEGLLVYFIEQKKKGSCSKCSKLKNILPNADCKLKIYDFGFARALLARTLTIHILRIKTIHFPVFTEHTCGVHQTFLQNIPLLSIKHLSLHST